MLDDFPWAQITLTVFTNQMVVMAIGLSSPFRYISDKYLELLNETNIMLCTYHMFLFTDFVSDPSARSKMGVSMIIFTLLNIGLNLGLLIYSTVREAHRLLKMKSLK